MYAKWGLRSRVLVYALVLWVVLPPALPILFTDDADFSAGILDDSDDDTLIVALSRLDLTFVASLPLLLQVPPWVVERAAPVDLNCPVRSVSFFPPPSRSPPLS